MTQDTGVQISEKEDGDMHDGDTGEYIFTLAETTGLPATLQVLYDGYWYTYKIEGRSKDTEDEGEIKKLKIDEAEVESEISTDPLKNL